MHKPYNLLWTVMSVMAFIQILLPTPLLNAEEDGVEKFRRATPEQRKLAVQEWKTQSKLEEFLKEAILLEYEKKYAEAISSLNSALSLQPTGIYEASIHLSLQRLYGATNDEVHERVELIWILNNVLKPNSRHHDVTQTFSAETNGRLIQRLKYYAAMGAGGFEMKRVLDDMGYPANVQQTGNIITVMPTYYEKGRTPITPLERKVYTEYKEETAKINKERAKAQEILEKLAAKYKMTSEDFIHLLLKVEYNEVPPNSYRSPSV